MRERDLEIGAGALAKHHWFVEPLHRGDFIGDQKVLGFDSLVSTQQQVPIEDLGGYRVQTLFHDDVEQVSLMEVVSEYANANATGTEGFLLQGQVAVNGQALVRHDWFRIAAHEAVNITGEGKLYLKVGALSRLKNDTGNAS